MCLLFALVTFWQRKSADIKFKEWDVNSVTVSDFSVMLSIDEETWNNWLQSQESKTLSFRKFLQNELIHILEQKSNFFHEKDSNTVKIACI